MPKIERRRRTITLHHGNYEQDLADLLAEWEAAVRAEENSGNRRAGTKSQAAALALKYDNMAARAEKTATKVTVWAIGHNDWSKLADEHPPRDDEPGDKQRGVNMKTLPADLLLASLAEPSDEKLELSVLLHEGKKILDSLDLSRLHYTKLETGAWNVNVGDDALPKFSLVSLHKQARGQDSERPQDSE